MINLVQLEPKVGTDCHHEDHAEVCNGEEDTVELLVDDIVHDVVYSGEADSLTHILLRLFPLVRTLRPILGNLIALNRVDHSLLRLDL